MRVDERQRTQIVPDVAVFMMLFLWWVNGIAYYCARNKNTEIWPVNIVLDMLLATALTSLILRRTVISLVVAFGWALFDLYVTEGHLFAVSDARVRSMWCFVVIGIAILFKLVRQAPRDHGLEKS